MPHLKVTPFDTSLLEQQLSKSQIITFRAKALKGDDELLGVEHG